MDLFNVNWHQRAQSDPVVNHFFKDYVFAGEYIGTNTTPVNIPKKTTQEKPNKKKKKKKKQVTK